MPKKHNLQSNYHFLPVAVETAGMYGKSTDTFLSDLAKKLVDTVCLVTPEGAPVALQAPVPSCGQRKCCQHDIGLCLYKFDLTLCSFLAVSILPPGWQQHKAWEKGSKCN